MKLSNRLTVAFIMSLAFCVFGLCSTVLAEAKIAKKAKNRPEILQDVISLEKDGNVKLAIEGYNKIISRFPLTKEAKIAENRLNKMEKIIREKCNFKSDAVMYSFNGIKENKGKVVIVNYVNKLAKNYPSVATEFKDGLKYDKEYVENYYEDYIEPLAEAVYNEVKSAEIQLDNKQYDEIRSLVFNECSENERDRTPAPAPEPLSAEN